MDIQADYNIVAEIPLIASAMTPGTMAMYLLHGAITSERRHLGDIIDAHERVDNAESLGYDLAQRCRQKMQLAFAANLYVGMFPHSEAEPIEQSQNPFCIIETRLK